MPNASLTKKKELYDIDTRSGWLTNFLSDVMAANDDDVIFVSPPPLRLCLTASELRKLRYISVCIGVILQTTTCI